MHRSNSNSSKYKQSLINRFELEYKSVSVRDLQKLSAAMYRLLAVNDKLMENLQTLPMHYRAQINILKKSLRHKQQIIDELKDKLSHCSLRYVYLVRHENTLWLLSGSMKTIRKKLNGLPIDHRILLKTITKRPGADCKFCLRVANTNFLNHLRSINKQKIVFLNGDHVEEYVQNIKHVFERNDDSAIATIEY
uniref:Uncharacterized protein n=1 Tax=Helicoverpa armigera nucleopolyhedrovirus TaxID=51313 RepID=A0A0E3JAQ2_9ABAC|nr:hypothetical protein ORF-127 [Helicoverpa armigera nucleopolyhedrovirus]